MKNSNYMNLMMNMMIHMKVLMNTKTIFYFFMDLIMYAIIKFIIFMYFDTNKSLIMLD